MWRLLSTITISLSMLLVSVSQGSAATWVDVYDPSDIFMDRHNDYISYTHNLTDNQYNPFNPLQDIITGASLVISLYDDWSDGFYRWEEVTVQLPGIWNDVTYSSVDISDVTLGLDLQCLFQLNTLGQLTIGILRESGDFWFGDSTLTAYGYDNTPVPEPCTMALLGAGMGMVGLARYRKRRAV